MRYGRSVKVSILKRVLPPERKSIRSTSRETGISEQTIRNWIKAAKDGKMHVDADEKSPRFYTSKEKHHILMEAARISEEDMGAFLRERGLHSFGTFNIMGSGAQRDGDKERKRKRQEAEKT